MDIQGKATRIELLNFTKPAMRTFHMTWFAFFLCFFAWFGIAPLMKVVRDEMNLTQEQIGWCIIGSVAITIVARLIIGWLCDRIGPRRSYAGLLILGSLPVMGIAFARDFETFLLFRVLIGVIGASFVITQYHTSLMFAPNCVGTANATTAGWGNMGGGVTQLVMPLLFALFVGPLAFGEALGWRLAMVCAAAACAVTGVAYYYLTRDTPEGDFKELRAAGKMPEARQTRGDFWIAVRDPRVWALFFVYAACFGVELTVNNVAALYFIDHFDWFQQMSTIQALQYAGSLAALFGLMNLFARTLGGAFGDYFGGIWGLSGRVKWLFLVLFAQGLALMLFSQMTVLLWAIPALLLFSLLVQMAEGATFAVVPFVNRRALGTVAGIVGAGGNAGAVAAGFLFKAETISWPAAFFILGVLVSICSFLSFAVTFSPAAEREARVAVAASRAMARQSLVAAET